MSRVFDVLISLSLILILSPLFIVISLVILFDTGLPIFFVQKRVGENCVLFNIIKFRTMFYDKSRNLGDGNSGLQSDNPYITTSFNDKRITRSGKFLRKFSLDELPQLFNVLIGEMSLVGPRPDTPVQIENYLINEWKERHKVKPGITGLAQINGRSSLSHSDRLKFDLNYIRNYSLSLYLSIILKTFTTLLKTKNIN